eukprot:snap_masked-scaffold_21-processed-gene-5.87-mRNA-1 protein AED:1.00 eAED:1.00 QI:0/-1/0/0/-1/1/1/0/231
MTEFIDSCQSPYLDTVSDGQKLYSWVYRLLMTLLASIGALWHHQRKWHPAISAREDWFLYLVLVAGLAWWWGVHFLYQSQKHDFNVCFVVMSSYFIASFAPIPIFCYMYITIKRTAYNRKLMELFDTKRNEQGSPVFSSLGPAKLSQEQRKGLEDLKYYSSQDSFLRIFGLMMTIHLISAGFSTLNACLYRNGSEGCSFFKDNSNRPNTLIFIPYIPFSFSYKNKLFRVQR